MTVTESGDNIEVVTVTSPVIEAVSVGTVGPAGAANPKRHLDFDVEADRDALNINTTYSATVTQSTHAGNPHGPSAVTLRAHRDATAAAGEVTTSPGSTKTLLVYLQPDLSTLDVESGDEILFQLGLIYQCDTRGGTPPASWPSIPGLLQPDKVANGQVAACYLGGGGSDGTSTYSTWTPPMVGAQFWNYASSWIWTSTSSYAYPTLLDYRFKVTDLHMSGGSFEWSSGNYILLYLSPVFVQNSATIHMLHMDITVEKAP